MRRGVKGTIKCGACGGRKNAVDCVPASIVGEGVAEVIRAEHPGWTGAGFICKEDLNRYRLLYIQKVIEREKGELTALEKDVLKSLADNELLSENIDAVFDQEAKWGEKVADRVAKFGGSWRFIGLFALIIGAWVAVNGLALWRRPFDPYPFILLNLILSCLAAIQAPVIMMSQNRQEAKDRLRSVHDYQTNLKAELEVRTLHEKFDHFLINEWQRLLEIQQIQTQLIEDLAERRGAGAARRRAVVK